MYKQPTLTINERNSICLHLLSTKEAGLAVKSGQMALRGRKCQSVGGWILFRGIAVPLDRAMTIYGRG